LGERTTGVDRRSSIVELDIVDLRPSVLKNAMDHTFVEWGNAGGARAVEQLRAVAIEVVVGAGTQDRDRVRHHKSGGD
jgi:hypothetical protein